MPKDRRCRSAKKANRAPTAKSKRAAFPLTAASDRDIPQMRTAEGIPNAPNSMGGVARLCIGVDSGSSGGTVNTRSERNRAQLRTKGGATKRLREDAGNGTTGAHSPAKRHKSSVISSLAPAATNIAIAFKRKAGKQPEAAKRHENDGDEEEDVELSKAVQAQTLSFLQHLNASSRKAFWELRDVAQGKRSAAATSATAALPASPSPSSSSKRATKGSAKEAKKLADDGEELWRVGGPYNPRDQDGDTDGSGGERGATSDCESQVSMSSSEPTWVTDSSGEEEDGGSDDKNDDDAESARVATGAARQRRTAGPPKRGSSGGGRLFQGGGDGVWDED
ncbi:hypothetical protein LSCM4_00450 [Leishmania orientalis]|uniref:Uncharacterized protein n=1 Tax=Leishmania orientalis TaxID=2249476 RepID=A0A836FZV3_9TRYP|nr:hypothetical protein LSCM4_00450 [Leishmania orientalis]